MNQNWVLKFDSWICTPFAAEQLIRNLEKSNGGMKTYGLYIKTHFSVTPLYITKLINRSIKADQNFIASHSEVTDHWIGQPFTKNELKVHIKPFWVCISFNQSTIHSIKILIQVILRLQVTKPINPSLRMSYNFITSHFEFTYHWINQSFTLNQLKY